MWKFLAGLFTGSALAVLYVAFNVQLPAFLQLPGTLTGNVISATIEQQLYESADPATRQRALEVYFDNRAADAATIDAAAGHPFLSALRRSRAAREASQLSMTWEAYDQALSQPALREALVRKHGIDDDQALKQAMLWDALLERVFLHEWLDATYGVQTPATLRDTLVDARRDPASTFTSP